MVNGYTSLGVGSYLRGQPTLRVAFCQSLLYGLRPTMFCLLRVGVGPSRATFLQVSPCDEGCENGESCTPVTTEVKDRANCVTTAITPSVLFRESVEPIAANPTTPFGSGPFPS